MKIEEFEEKIIKYDYMKINNFIDLKNYLSNPYNYAHNFTPEEITEGYIDNSDYYGAYVFNEENIANRKYYLSMILDGKLQ